MSERIIYTCDSCGTESTSREGFEELTLTRRLNMKDPDHLWYSAVPNGGVIIARGIFCERCCKEHFDLALLPPPPKKIPPEEEFLVRVVSSLMKFVK